MSVFGEMLQYLRKSNNVSQGELARVLGVSRSSVSMYELGEREPGFETLEAIADYFNVDMNTLTGFEQENPPVFYEAEGQAELNQVYLQLSRDNRAKVLDIAKLYLLDPQNAAPKEERLVPMPQPRRVRRRSDGFVEIEVYVDQLPAAGYSSYFDTPQSRVEQYPRDMIPPKTTFGVIISGISMQPQYKDRSTAFVESVPRIESGEVGLFSLNGEPYIKQLIVDEERREVRLHSFNPLYEDIVVHEFDDLRTFGRVIGSY